MIQNNACRMITRDGKYASVVGMHRDLELKFLTDRRVYHVSAFTFKFVKGLTVDMNIHGMFRALEYQHGRDTRAQSRNDFIVRVSRTRMGERAFSIYGSKVWNCLLVEVQETNTTETFTRKYWLTHSEMT